ncbi:MAG TPA: flagellar biosynthesis protein FlhA [Myxococcaceae bacterium]|nr:flagellar biosynthesis protein FlhA [Myxococcaceae bacterium]
MDSVLKLLSKVRSSTELILAVVVAVILATLIIPLPAWLLDVGLAINLAASVALLVAALFAKDALQLTSFPTLLLLTTLLRLALNVSSTRLALAEGHAGQIIQAFGEFVVRGEYVVGAVVFAILTLVQLLVVAKGAERVAEVSARFTLDAMPGKQMSIDADLRAGAIDQAQARRRRRELERESQMFGAMDGAMKFIKGDAIAGLVIVAVNLLGGTLLGVLQNGMSLAEAAGAFSLIAIGDGLVSQLPSLCITVAAGLLVTRVASESEGSALGAEIGRQLLGQDRVAWVVAGVCVALALVPGMPHLTFLGVAGVAGVGAWRMRGSARGTVVAEAEPGQAAADGEGGGPVSANPAQASTTAAGVAPLIIDLAPDLTELTREDGGRFIRQELEDVREQLYAELGIRMPQLRLRVGAAYLPRGGYSILLDEVPCARGQVAASELYALAPPADLGFLEVKAEPMVEPATGRPISRVPRECRERLELAQVPVRLPRALIAEHLRATLRRRAATLLGVQEVQVLVDALSQQAPALVKEGLGKVPLPLLTDVLRRLVQEEVSVRNLRAIFETLVSPTTEGDAQALAERCRQGLSRYLSHRYAPGGALFAYLVDPSVESVLREQGAHGGGLDPDRVSGILEAVRRIAAGGRAVLLVAPDVRRALRKLCEGAFPEVAVLTYAELEPELQVRPLGRLLPAR